jgi:predicted flap endonuclease-1-like 5' DNA nuclease
MSLAVNELKGITKELVEALKMKGITDSNAFLEAAKSPKDRKNLATSTGVESSVILNLANRADLARISGIGSVYSDLLEEAGVDTVKELAQRSATNLHAKIMEINTQKELTNRPPSVDQLMDFIKQAHTLPASLEY